MEQAAWFGDALFKTARARAFACTGSGHENCLREQRLEIVPFSQLAVRTELFYNKTHIPGVGTRITEPEEMSQRLRESLAGGRPQLFDVAIAS